MRTFINPISCLSAFIAEEVAIKVILKLIHLENQLFNRARGGALVLYRLNHPHVVRAMDGGEVEGMAYIVMEELEGLTLQALLSQLGPLTVYEALAIALQIAEALEAAHAMPIAEGVRAMALPSRTGVDVFTAIDGTF